MQIVVGGGFRLLTADPVMIAVVRRCAQLEHEIVVLRRRLDRRAKRADARREP